MKNWHELKIDMIIKKHHNFNYILSKLKMLGFELKNPNSPWLTKDSISLLGQLILQSDTGLEFGSGRSTKWLALKCNKLISVESNKLWFNKVSNDLIEFVNVEYHYKEVDEENYEKSTYLDVFDSVEDNSVDFILDDGKIRDLVALKSLPKLKYGGLFILDNAERYIPNELKIPESIGNDKSLNENWNNFMVQTNSWRRIWTNNGISSTLIFIKS